METNTKKSSKKPKQEKSEEQLVREYADKVVKMRQSTGYIDKRFDYSIPKQTTNKELWTDTDFYFSVVFQSSKQKNEFLNQLVEKYKIPVEKDFADFSNQIISGLIFAQALGFKLSQEQIEPNVMKDVDLREFILDTYE